MESQFAGHAAEFAAVRQRYVRAADAAIRWVALTTRRRDRRVRRNGVRALRLRLAAVRQLGLQAEAKRYEDRLNEMD